MIIGYTTGVFDLFHIGHVNILKKSKQMCDKLIVGVTVDELVSYKHKKCIIPFKERIEIIQSCKFVDLAVPQFNMNKIDAYKRYKFNKLFVGDDWYQTDKWNKIENDLKKFGVEVTYFPYTEGTSSTLINDILKKIRKT